MIFADKIVYVATDSVLDPLPAEPDALMGWDPYFAVLDELHAQKSSALPEACSFC